MIKKESLDRVDGGLLRPVRNRQEIVSIFMKIDVLFDDLKSLVTLMLEKNTTMGLSIVKDRVKAEDCSQRGEELLKDEIKIMKIHRK